MPDGMYSVLALLPESSDFSLDVAVAHFGKQRWRKGAVRAELAIPQEERKPGGFRVFFGDWSVFAWLESGESVLSDSQDIAEDDDLPAPAAEIAACSRRLSVWSDEDPDLEYGDQIGQFADDLRERFGAFIYDDVNGGWWT